MLPQAGVAMEVCWGRREITERRVGSLVVFELARQIVSSFGGVETDEGNTNGVGRRMAKTSDTRGTCDRSAKGEEITPAIGFPWYAIPIRLVELWTLRCTNSCVPSRGSMKIVRSSIGTSIELGLYFDSSSW